MTVNFGTPIWFYWFRMSIWTFFHQYRVIQHKNHKAISYSNQHVIPIQNKRYMVLAFTWSTKWVTYMLVLWKDKWKNLYFSQQG
jgi:hypothetical protein